MAMNPQWPEELRATPAGTSSVPRAPCAPPSAKVANLAWRLAYPTFPHLTRHCVFPSACGAQTPSAAVSG